MSVTFLTNEDRKDLERMLLPKPTGKAEVGQLFVVRGVNKDGEIIAVETVPDDYAKIEDIPKQPEDIGALPNTYTPPNQTAEQVGADPKGTAVSAVSQHNTADDSHGDIRLELKAINDRLTAFFDSDNQTLDELSEIVAYITSNKSLIDSITTSKVSVADIVNNLITNVSNKPLSAAQGVVLKGLIDTVSNSLSSYALKSEIPTKVSQLQNDAEYLTQHQDVSGLLPRTELPTAIDTALAQAKASGAFDGPKGNPGTSVTVKSVSESTADGGSNVVTFSDDKTVTIKNGRAGKTPVKGTDYWTDADKAEMIEALADDESIKNFGAVGDGVVDDTVAFQRALANADVLRVTKGTYALSDTLTIRSGCKLVLDRDVHLKFTQTNKHGIVMQKFAILDGGNGSVSVPSGFTQGVIVFDTDLDNPSKMDVFPYENWSPMQKYGRTVRNLDIVRTLPNGRLESDNGSCSGTAIYLHANGAATITFLWACIIDHVNISGAFSYGIRAVNDNGGWINDTKMEAVYIDSCEVGVSLENMHNAYVDCIIQPRAALNGVKYAKQGLKLINSQHCYALGLKVWDWQLAATGDEYKHIAMYGNCGDLVFADITYDNYSKASDFWAATVYTDTPSNLENITLINEPNTKWFYNSADVPYFRKESGVERLATFADLQANFGTSIVPDFENRLSTAINQDGTIYNGVGYKKGYRVDGATGEEVKMSDNTYTATGFIPVNNTDVIRFANLSMSINGYCVYVAYNENFERIAHMTSQIISTSSAEYLETVLDGNGNIVQFTLKAAAGAAYIRFTFMSHTVFTSPAISINEEITYSTHGSLSPDIAVDYNSLINVPKPTDLSIYQSKNIVDSGGYFGTDTVDGALQEIGSQLNGLAAALEALL